MTTLKRASSTSAVAPLIRTRVLLIGINYAPEPTGIAPYTTGLAQFLSSRVHELQVLTGIPHYPSWEATPGFRPTRSQELADGVRLTRLRHYVPSRQTALTRAVYEATFLANALTAPVNRRPDLVIGITPSLGGAVAAAKIARRHGSRLFVLIQDLMAKASTQSGIPGGHSVSGVIQRIEGYALRRADRVGVVSNSFRAQVSAYGVPGDLIDLVPNWTHIPPVTTTRREARERLGWPQEKFLVVHTGNMGLKQDLGNVLEAARMMADRSDVQFYLVGDGSQRPHLEQAAQGLRNVTFVPPLSADDYPASLAGADVLVLNERATVGDMSLPSKLTSYLSSRRPVLAAVDLEGAAAKELARTGGAALRVDPGAPAQFVEAVLKLQGSPERREAMASAGRLFAERELSATHALSLMERALVRTMDQPYW